MRLFRLTMIALAVVLFVSWLSITFYPSVQDFMKANPFWNGLRDFSAQFKADLVATPNEVPTRGKNTVLITISYHPYSDEDLARITDFVNTGGTLLVMDDYGYGNQVLHALGLDMEFYGQPLLDPYLNYRNQWLPVVTDLAPEIREAGIKQLTLNHATALRVGKPYEVLARSSDTAYLDENGNETWDKGETKGPLVVAARAAVGQGGVIAISDPSILINSMIERGDNAAFLKEIIQQAGETRIVVDTSELPKSPLDRSKSAWQTARERMALPYSQVLLVGAILSLTLLPLWQKGVKVEQE